VRDDDRRKGTALVTGGAVRLGSHIARHLAELGYAVVVHCHRSIREGMELCAALRAEGHDADVCSVDLNDVKAIEPMIRTLHDKHPDLSVLVNNAALFGGTDFLATEIEDFDRMLSLNLRAPFFLTQAFARHVRQGQVVNVLDAYVNKNCGTRFAYQLSKKALLALTQMSAAALGPGLRVNAVAPGLVIPAEGGSEASYADYLTARTPLQRIPEVEDVLRAIRCFLESVSVTGQIAVVDSGYSL
jgi:pteridine reductase